MDDETPRECPILFSGPMVQAILGKRKTQTRRVVRLPQTRGVLTRNVWRPFDPNLPEDREGMVSTRANPYGQPGDRLWVRETWYCDHVFAGDHAKTCVGCVRCSHTDTDRIAQWREEMYYRADGEPDFEGERAEWRPSIHMPRWASRLTLEVTGVRVQRLQDISEEDAKAEGVNGPFDELFTPRRRFEALWDSINGERPGCTWEANPWVWAVSFRKL